MVRKHLLPLQTSEVVCPSFKLGDRLDDVSWDSHAPGTLAFASSISQLTVLDLNKVRYLSHSSQGEGIRAVLLKTSRRMHVGFTRTLLILQMYC
jgi:hypothetical protein